MNREILPPLMIAGATLLGMEGIALVHDFALRSVIEQRRIINGDFKAPQSDSTVLSRKPNLEEIYNCDKTKQDTRHYIVTNSGGAPQRTYPSENASIKSYLSVGTQLKTSCEVLIKGEI